MEDHKSRLIRFALLFAILIFYFTFVSLKYGVKNGLSITFLTWSFFVLCTPIADAGFLLDFPIRLLTGIRMIHSEIIVWVIAISMNLYSLLFMEGIYEKTVILLIFHHILTNPLYWSIIILSGIGTFISIHLADGLFDLSIDAHHSKFDKIHKYKTYF